MTGSFQTIVTQGTSAAVTGSMTSVFSGAGAVIDRAVGPSRSVTRTVGTPLLRCDNRTSLPTTSPFSHSGGRPRKHHRRIGAASAVAHGRRLRDLQAHAA